MLHGYRLLVEAQVCRLVVVERVAPIQLVPELLGKVLQVALVRVLSPTLLAVAVALEELAEQRLKLTVRIQAHEAAQAVLVWCHPSLALPPITVVVVAAVYTVCLPTKTLRVLWVA